MVIEVFESFKLSKEVALLNNDHVVVLAAQGGLTLISLTLSEMRFFLEFTLRPLFFTHQ